MLVNRLQASVQQFFHHNATLFGLTPEAITVEYVLNWGGFVNHSFRIRDGRTSLHLKLSTSDDGKAALRRWQRLSPILERYHAPRVLDWVELEEAAGLLFPFVSGSSPAFDRPVIDALLPLLGKLNQDHELFAALGGEAVPTRTTYFRTYHDRFREDLRLLMSEQPKFVSNETLVMLLDEVGELARLVNASDAFAEESATPIHGDLWLSNILWTDANNWNLLDWDDVRVGDPAMDLAMLTGPAGDDLAPLKRYELVTVGQSTAVCERLRLLGRASLLDWVIDPVADWIDADVAPELSNDVRAEKERIHRAAWALYRKEYLS